ncbi:MAG: hypothetical protein ACXWP4_11795, partial [Polyangiales bacterium]
MRSRCRICSIAFALGRGPGSFGKSGQSTLDGATLGAMAADATTGVGSALFAIGATDGIGATEGAADGIAVVGVGGGTLGARRATSALPAKNA